MFPGKIYNETQNLYPKNEALLTDSELQ
jgi:hypothetical protein